jgi:AraC-like DNA-binding protein
MTIEDKNSLKLLNAFLNLQITHIAIANFDWHGRNTYPHNRLFLVFKDDGRGGNVIHNRIVNQQMEMQANYIYFMPRDLELELDITPGISFISFHFNLELFYGFDVFSGYQHCKMIKNAPLITKIRKCLDDENNLKSLCSLKSYIYGLCTSFCDINTLDIKKNIMACRKYESIFTFIRNHGDATTTVEALAEIAGQRQDIFSRTFSSDLGLSPKHYLTRDLLRKAAERLLLPDTTARMVSEQLNFSSEYYFSRFFKKHIGLSPRQFQSQTCHEK